MVDVRPLSFVVGLLLCGLGVAMLLPAAVDAMARNPDWQVFLASAGMTFVAGGLLVSTTHHEGALRFDRRQAFLLIVACWLLLPGVSAVPFLGLGLDYSDAFFEAMSGMTTTGSTVIVGLDRLPPGILLWRSLLQWIGGVGIVVMAIMVLPFLRVGGMQIFRIESSEKSEKVVPKAVDLASWIAKIYVVLTGLAALAYFCSGMSMFDALCHAMTTLATGGYSTHDASFGFFTNPFAHWFGALFMLAGALPFVAYIKLAKGDSLALYRDAQVRALVAFLLVVCLALGVWLWQTQQIAFLDALRLATFNVVSILTTTGYASADYSAWGPPAVGLFLTLTFLGGCTGSTSGGIKVYRFQILWIVVRTHVRHLITPHRMVARTYGGRILPTDIPDSVLAFLAVYFATVGIFTLALSAMGLDLVTALSATAQAIGNVGPGLGPIVGPSGNFAPLPDAAKWVLSLAMLLGRLELFAVLVLLDPDFWRS